MPVTDPRDRVAPPAITGRRPTRPAPRARMTCTTWPPSRTARSCVTPGASSVSRGAGSVARALTGPAAAAAGAAASAAQASAPARDLCEGRGATAREQSTRPVSATGGRVLLDFPPVEIMLAIALGAAAAWAAVATARLSRARSRERARRSEAREAAAAAADAAARAEALLDAVTSVAIRVDGAGRVARVGRRAAERFPFLAPGMGLLEAFSEHRLARGVEAALEALEPQRFEVRLFADGRRTYRAAVEPYAVGAGREALVLLADVSEAVAYQELRSQFVANVSHELRTPLTGLRGLLEALADPAMDERTRADFVARCINETQRLEALVGDILFLSELEATHGLPPEDGTDLARAVREAAAGLAGAAEGQGVALVVDAPEPVPCPLGERMARTVAVNLLENAVKYAGPGATARASVRRDGDRVLLRVADDGAGIPERHLPHIFERFYRADPSRSKRMGGTGLGLSIVKHIAERFGGGVEATSREGFGTAVTVALPAPRDGSAGPPRAEGAEGAQGPEGAPERL